MKLSCEQEFFEAQQLKMCINCFRYELSYILASQTIKTFEELCSKAHDLEAQIFRKKGKKRRKRVRLERLLRLQWWRQTKPVTRRVCQNRFRGYAVQYFLSEGDEEKFDFLARSKKERSAADARRRSTRWWVWQRAAYGRMYFANVEFATPKRASSEGR